MPAKKKIYIVDDHPLMRKGMAMTLENSVEFTFVASRNRLKRTK